MRRTRCLDAAALLLAVLLAGAPARGVRAEDDPPTTAKARWTARMAEEEAQREWGPPLRARLQAWRNRDRFEEIRAAVDDALERFPDPQAVALVVGAVEYINSDNVRWEPEREGLNAWNSELALRALTRLPRPPRARDHRALVQRGVLLPWMNARPTEKASDDRNVRQELTQVARFLRRLSGDEARLWTPLPRIPAPDRPYAPVRRSDPRYGMLGWSDTPADEEGFLAYEEAWYAARLHGNELGDVREGREGSSIPYMVDAFVHRFPPGSPAEVVYREMMPFEVPELPWIALLDAARRSESESARRNRSRGVSFWVSGLKAGTAPSVGRVGQDLELEVHALNQTATTQCPVCQHPVRQSPSRI